MGKYKLGRAAEKLDQSYDNPAYSGYRSHLWTEGSDFAKRGTAKKRITWIAIAVVVVAAIAIAITLIVVLRDDKKDKEDVTSTSTSTTSSPTAEWLSQPCYSQQTLPECPWSNKPLLLVSLDGFRAEYVLRNYTPVIQKLRSCGVHTPYMRAVYPTLTFPNHYTIVTGLYPESHDVVGNRMYDPVINKSFSLGSDQKLNPAWYGGEPIWITAKKQGKRTASYFWPGSDVNISGIYPDKWHLFNESVRYEERVDTVLGWLRLPDGQRPDFMTVYITEPDKQGHSSGPDSDEINEMLRKVDTVVGRLMSGLHDQRIEHCVNLVITADHGMSKQSCSQAVFVQNYSPAMSDMLMQRGPTGNLFPQYVDSNGVTSNRQDDIDLEVFVNNLTCRHPAMKVFTKSTIPRRHHFSNSRRIGEVVLLMADEWNVFRNELGFCTGGNHGWDEIYKNMHALFLAHGPAFKENFTTEPFENIELYNMMCDILDITPAANNGTEGRLNAILKSPKSVDNISTLDYDTCSHSGDRLKSCYCSSDFTVVPSDVYLNTSDDVLYFGEPRLVVNDSACVLHQKGFSVGYSKTSKSPVWLATTVTSTQKATDFNTNSSCVLQDTRVSTDCPPSIDKDGLELISLGGPGIDNGPETARLSSTLVPMYTEFKQGVWQIVLKLLDDYVSRFGSLSVTMGTIYDYNDDSLWEGKISETKYADSAKTLPIPSHIYIIIVKCQTTEEQLPCNNQVDVLSFILPHLTSPTNCMTMASYLQDNMARIRDIELLTGLQFLTDVNHNIAVLLKTFLPEDIWPSSIFPEWVDLPCPQEDLCQQDYKPLLVVSLDGFRADYLIRNFTPTIARLSQCGAHAPFMRSVYPTKTFPSHYSIVTGLYPESHGIVDNFMFDLDFKKTFTLGGEEKLNGRWYGGEPIWLTAQKQGLKAATYFWTGSDANISGMFPETYRVYDGSVTYPGRVQDVLSWFLRPRDQRPDLVTLYFDEPDLSGHRYGPSNEEGIAEALERVDKSINELMTGLVRFNLHNCVNLVIIADHGMEDVNCTREVLLSDYVDSRYLSSNFWVWDGTVGRIANTYIFSDSVPGSVAPAQNPEPVDEIVANLTCASPDMNVYTPSSTPIRYHYSNNDRIGKVLIDVVPGATVRRRPSSYCRLGRHGYDNIYKSMEALFLAYGPAFKWNYTMEPFEAIELYNLLTDVLNITAAPNNGTAGSLSHILHKAPKTSPTTKVPDNQLADAFELYKQLGDYAGVEERYCNGSCDHPTKAEDIYRSLCCPRNGSDDLPFGLPTLVSSDLGIRNLTYMYHEDHVTLFDVDAGKVIWTMRTFLKSETTNVMEAVKDSASQLTPDLTQNAALRGIIDALGEMASNWLTSYEQLNVFTGYGYDENHDSLPDTHISSDTLPTHFYIVFATCDTRSSLNKDCEDIKVRSYIVPRHDGNQACKPAEDYLIDVEARVRDVEILSGFELFTSVPANRAVRVRTFLPQRP